jgi:hypothetical protein
VSSEVKRSLSLTWLIICTFLPSESKSVQRKRYIGPLESLSLEHQEAQTDPRMGLGHTFSLEVERPVRLTSLIIYTSLPLSFYATRKLLLLY